MNRRRWSLIAAVTLAAFAATPARADEVCGDGLDNDGDGLTDDGCWPFGAVGICENPLSCAITGTIGPKSGTIVYPLRPDVEAAVAYGPALTFKRTVLSYYQPAGGVAAYRRPLGVAWQHNWMSWLDLDTTPDPDRVVVHSTEGREITFTFDKVQGGYSYYAPQVGAMVNYLRQSQTTLQWEMRMLSGTHTGLVGGFRPPRPPRDGLEDDA